MAKVVFPQTNTSICEQFKKIKDPKVSGSTEFKWSPCLSENGISFTGTIKWEFYFFGCPALGGKFSPVITGNSVIIDGKSYSSSDLGSDIFSKVTPYSSFSSGWNQKAIIYFDIYQNDVFLKTIAVTSKNFMDSNCYDKLKTYFSKEDICNLFVNGFTMRVSKIENMCFDGIDKAKNVIKEKINKK